MRLRALARLPSGSGPHDIWIRATRNFSGGKLTTSATNIAGRHGHTTISCLDLRPGLGPAVDLPTLTFSDASMFLRMARSGQWLQWSLRRRAIPIAPDQAGIR